MHSQSIIPIAHLDKQYALEILKQLEHNIQTATLQKQNTSRTLRDTFNFGYDYFAMANNDFTFTAVPHYLQQLCQRCIEAFGHQYQLADYTHYKNIIISLYHPGYQLEPHVDVDISDKTTDGKKVDFHFGENVLGVILKPDSEGQFFITEPSEQKISHLLEEDIGTVYLLNGKFRRHPYLHGVSKVKNKRISITFRTVVLDK